MGDGSGDGLGDAVGELPEKTIRTLDTCVTVTDVDVNIELAAVTLMVYELYSLLMLMASM